MSSWSIYSQKKKNFNKYSYQIENVRLFASDIKMQFITCIILNCFQNSFDMFYFFDDIET